MFKAESFWWKCPIFSDHLILNKLSITSLQWHNPALNIAKYSLGDTVDVYNKDKILSDLKKQNLYAEAYYTLHTISAYLDDRISWE